jgi:hypothetical protein
MYEELLIAGENVLPTSHEKIKVLTSVTIDKASCEAELEQLCCAARTNDIVGITEGLRRLVPEYTPTYHFNGDVPPSFRRMRPDLHAGQRGGSAEAQKRVINNGTADSRLYTQIEPEGTNP